MSNSQTESLEDRLAKRRRLRNRRFNNKNSYDESEVTSINQSPATTRSLDRKSSKHISQVSLLNSPTPTTQSPGQTKSLSTINRNPEAPLSGNSYHSSETKNSSTPLLPQIAEHRSLESQNVKQASSKSLSANEQQQNFSQHDAKPLINKEVVSPVALENPNPGQEKARKNFEPHHDEKPLIIKQTVSPVNHPATTENSNPTPEKPRQNFQPSHDEKSVIIKETDSPVYRPAGTEQPNLIQSKIHENPHSHHDEKPRIIKETVPAYTAIEKSNPVIIKKTIPPALPSVTPLTTIEKSKPINKNPLLIRMKDHAHTPSYHPSSDPQSSTDSQPKHFPFPPFHSKPIARTTSEQIVSMNKPKHQPINSIFAKRDSLALSYLFSKRMIDSESARLSSSDDKQSQTKTVWD